MLKILNIETVNINSRKFFRDIFINACNMKKYLINNFSLFFIIKIGYLYYNVTAYPI
jgi:hypothetical protein